MQCILSSVGQFSQQQICVCNKQTQKSMRYIKSQRLHLNFLVCMLLWIQFTNFDVIILYMSISSFWIYTRTKKRNDRGQKSV